MRKLRTRLKVATAAFTLALAVSAAGVATPGGAVAASEPWPTCYAWNSSFAGQGYGSCVNQRPDVYYRIWMWCAYEPHGLPRYTVWSTRYPTTMQAYVSCYFNDYALPTAHAVVDSPPPPPPSPPPPSSPPPSSPPPPPPDPWPGPQCPPICNQIP